MKKDISVNSTHVETVEILQISGKIDLKIKILLEIMRDIMTKDQNLWSVSKTIKIIRVIKPYINKEKSHINNLTFHLVT